MEKRGDTNEGPAQHNIIEELKDSDFKEAPIKKSNTFSSIVNFFKPKSNKKKNTVDAKSTSLGNSEDKEEKLSPTDMKQMFRADVGTFTWDEGSEIQDKVEQDKTLTGFSSIAYGAPPVTDPSKSRLASVQNLAEILGEDCLEVDMGKLNEEERQFMIVDKDSGKVYDIRKESHLERLSESQISLAESQDQP